MNLSALKAGFASYLEDLNQISNRNYKNTFDDVSIFKYSSEFKDFIAQEYNTDNSIFSMSINDILDMDVVNGKLVDPDAQESGDSFTSTTKNEQKTNNDTNNIQNLTSLMSNNNQGAQNTNNQNQENMMAGLVNEMLKMDEVNSIVDADASQNIDEEELTNFLNTVNAFDNNEDELTIDDIMGALEAIENGEFSLATKEDEELTQQQAQAAQNATPAQSASPASGASPVGSSGGTSGASGASGSNGNFSMPNTNSNTEKTLDNMTKQELQSELSKAEGDLSDKQAVLDGIMDGSDPEIKAAQEEVDQNYEKYQEELKAVDEDMAKQVDDLKTKQDDKQSEIDKKDVEIADQEAAASEAESNYNNAVTSRENLEASLDALESAESSAEGDKKSELSGKISSLKSKIADAKQKETDAKTAWDQAEEKLKELEGDKEKLQGELSELDKQMTALEEQIAQKYPQIKEFQDAYNQSKDDLQTKKDSAITTAKSDISKAQDHVNEVNTALNDLESKEENKEYGLDGKALYNEELGKKLAQAGLTTRGTTGYCLGGVNDSLQEVFGKTLAFPSAYMAADALRGNTAGYEDLASNFKEVEVPRSELANLPAGAIVVWDNNANGGGSNVSAAGKKHGHISIALGDGRESSDHISNQIVNRDAEYTVFYPV